MIKTTVTMIILFVIWFVVYLQNGWVWMGSVGTSCRTRMRPSFWTGWTSTWTWTSLSLTISSTHLTIHTLLADSLEANPQSKCTDRFFFLDAGRRDMHVNQWFYSFLWTNGKNDYICVKWTTPPNTRFNPLMLTAAKTSRTILLKSSKPKHNWQNIWRRNGD